MLRQIYTASNLAASSEDKPVALRLWRGGDKPACAAGTGRGLEVTFSLGLPLPRCDVRLDGPEDTSESNNPF
jgi:hypothetical protein